MGPITSFLYWTVLVFNILGEVKKPLQKNLKKMELLALAVTAAFQLASSSVLVSVQEYEYENNKNEDHYDQLQFSIIAGFCCLAVVVIVTLCKVQWHFQPPQPWEI